MNDGNKTRLHLINWTAAQTAAEGLASQIIQNAGFTEIEPSHPLGGPDGLKDIICKKNGLRWIGAVYFPTEQLSINKILKKFREDLLGVERNDAVGIAFVTNQNITLQGRAKITEVAESAEVELFHLERVVTMLNNPACYGIRLEYLGIEMSREEQVSYFSTVHETIFDKFSAIIQQHIGGNSANRTNLSEEMRDIQNVLSSFFKDPIKRSFLPSFLFDRKPTIEDFKELISQVESLETALPTVVRDLGHLRTDIGELMGFRHPLAAMMPSTIFGKNIKLSDAMRELNQYGYTLDNIITKQKEVQSRMSDINKNIGD